MRPPPGSLGRPEHRQDRLADHAITGVTPQARGGAWFGSGGLNAQCPTARPRDNRSPAASEGRSRGSDLAVTAGELNAGAGVATKQDGEETPGDRHLTPRGW